MNVRSYVWIHAHRIGGRTRHSTPQVPLTARGIACWVEALSPLISRYAKLWISDNLCRCQITYVVFHLNKNILSYFLVKKYFIYVNEVQFQLNLTCSHATHEARIESLIVYYMSLLFDIICSAYDVGCVSMGILYEIP